MTRRLATVLIAFAMLLPAVAAADTTAVAVNTKDGASLFRLAFQVRRVADAVADESNAAAAVASCTECQTVALSFQAVLLFGQPEVVTPENLALALNQECSDCLTYAAATQLVLGFDGPVHLTAEGQRRLHALREELRELGTQDSWTIEQLEAAVDGARTELRDILATEVVPAGPPASPTESTTTTNTTERPSSTASTTTTTTRASTTTTHPTTTTTTTTTPSTTTSTP